ncbi:MBL fold metallo-hydrolase [Terrabacter sp. C0L_2]|jgi:L-ascorbate metabolism protein UlaG (beta-lactamase superfamily)|uniref:MBL fold metallo-hydrolase n=1 Tax=Terrabacter sp. C0L_2 TaxID=3108389 RepID=UPI002ED37CF4|nr:MBL fold metallo-hydrolase [Terrabacter sp. C0L_2]
MDDSSTADTARTGDAEPTSLPQAALTFIGTATTVIELGSFTLLTDPNFLHRGQRAYLGKGLWSRRLTDPAITVEQLPRLDTVLLSHLHGDHFDRVARHGLSRDVPVVTTQQAARRLSRWGFTTQGLSFWDQVSMSHGEEDLTITSVPAIHARGLLRAALPPVMGSVVEHRVAGRLRHRLYVSGDTLTGSHLDGIRSRFPDIDTAVVHLGGTRILMHTVTMDADQGVDFVRRTSPRQAVPVHHSDYGVFRSPLRDFLRATDDAGLRVIRPVGPGERLDLTDPGLPPEAGRFPRRPG